MLVTKPMWLKRVELKLNKDKYQNAKAFFSDIYLIWENCKKFNQEISVIYRTAQALEIETHEIEALFNKEMEETDDKSISESEVTEQKTQIKKNKGSKKRKALKEAKFSKNVRRLAVEKLKNDIKMENVAEDKEEVT
jgi:hypothetical protein